MHRILRYVVICLTGVAMSPPARAEPFAVPYAIVFVGGTLREPLVIRDRVANEAIMRSLVRHDLVPSDTARRGSLEVGVFYARNAGAVEGHPGRISMALADMRYRYYVASGTRPALLIPQPTLSAMRPSPQAFSTAGVAVLARHGVPTR